MKQMRGRIWVRRAVWVMAALLLAFVGWGYLFMPRMLMSLANRAVSHGPYAVNETAQALHTRLLVADLHCDALLWCRNLLKRDTQGMVDVPRLIEGNVALQVFSAVTRMPVLSNFTATRNVGDILVPLVYFQGWPASTWFSPRERALYQARVLDKAAQQSNGLLTVVRTKEELARYLENRAANPKITAGLLSIEGLHALEGDLENTRVFFNAGYRMMSPSHFFDTEVGGSAQGLEKGGLTNFGRRVIQFMEQLHVTVDLAHASPKLFDDVLDIATRPLVVSHGGVQGTCPNSRNLSDGQLRRLAENGGVAGIGYWNKATCGEDVDSILRAIQHAVSVAGADHVALGSDFDGATVAPFDTSGVALITQGLMNAGMAESDIAKIMGGNVFRLLHENLPSEKDSSGIPQPK